MHALLGTSGYNYDAWKGRFYPEKLSAKKMLGFYAAHFPTVEINYTFYRKPSVKTFEGWATQTPPTFRFALKAWQRITHQQRLREAGDLLTSFCEVTRTLGEKRGPILFQLPPYVRKDLPVLTDFLAQLPRDVAAAFEFRHASWFDEAIYRALSDAGAALCIAESEELATPVVRTAAHGYFRLRRADYDEAALETWATRIRDAGFTKDVFVFLKHEAEGKGPQFAATLATKLQR